MVINFHQWAFTIRDHTTKSVKRKMPSNGPVQLPTISEPRKTFFYVFVTHVLNLTNIFLLEVKKIGNYEPMTSVTYCGDRN